ncbi:MAG: hypothetical protein RIB80_13005 [Rhodospirillales bacterium]
MPITFAGSEKQGAVSRPSFPTPPQSASARAEPAVADNNATTTAIHKMEKKTRRIVINLLWFLVIIPDGADRSRNRRLMAPLLEEV